jgi:DHA1 family bicyclomycin/chloramphenicol resistance-like MFS transporter
VTPQRLPLAEFITLVAVMFAMIAFGIDSMLPAFPQIASDLGLSDVNQAQLVITVFFLGTGIGQLIMGPLSDAIGRKPVILGGILLYILGCVQAVYSGTLEGLLVARMVQGIGVSAPRTVTLALIRDLYSGRLMARVMSLSMTLFVLVPAIAPLLGQTIMLAFGWRAIFVAFILFALIGALWLGLRQGETHPVEKRRKIRLGSYLTAMREVATNRVVMTYTLAMSLGYGGLFAYLSSAQQIFVGTFDKGQDFPLYFAGIAIISGGSGLVNSWLVMRLGMRRLATGSFGIMMVVSLGLAAVERFGALSPDHAFTLFLIWSALSFFSAGLTFGNLNALAMEPMGHIAGMAAAVMGALSTAIGVAVAIPIGQAFDGTALPLIFSFGVAMGIALLLMLSDPKAA